MKGLWLRLYSFFRCILVVSFMTFIQLWLRELSDDTCFQRGRLVTGYDKRNHGGW